MKFRSSTCIGFASGLFAATGFSPVWANGNNSIPSKEKVLESRPNVLLILVDDLVKEWIECYGAQNISLPNITKLSEQSIIFNRAYSMPQSTPSRVALMTGQYPCNNGWVNHYDVPRWGHGAHFDVDLNPSFPLTLKKSGYRTCIAGKWQLNDFRLEPDAMNKIGFDEYCMWTGGEGGNEKISESRYWDPYIHTKEGSKVYKGMFGPDIYSDFIVEFIKKNKKSPMFVYYPMTLTHTPFVHTPHAMQAKTNYEKHKAMVEYTDFIIGKLMKCLEDCGIDDNTYIMLITDNGTTPGAVGKRNDRYIRGGKTYLSENGINCPMIVHVPGAKKGRISNAVVDFTDFRPTLLDITGCKDDGKYPMDGKSFKPVLENKVDYIDGKIGMSMGCYNATISSDDRVINRQDFKDRVVIGPKYKVYLSQERTVERVYNMLVDETEKNNLIGNKAEVEQAMKELGAFIDALPIKDANPKYNVLKHNPANNTPINEVKCVKSNFMKDATEQDYNNFINPKKKK